MARSGLKGDAGGRLRRGKRSIIRVINTNRYCTGRGKGGAERFQRVFRPKLGEMNITA